MFCDLGSASIWWPFWYGDDGLIWTIVSSLLSFDSWGGPSLVTCFHKLRHSDCWIFFPPLWAVLSGSSSLIASHPIDPWSNEHSRFVFPILFPIFRLSSRISTAISWLDSTKVRRYKRWRVELSFWSRFTFKAALDFFPDCDTFTF